MRPIIAHRNRVADLVAEPEPATVDKLVTEFVKVNVRRCVQSRWPLVEIRQFPIRRTFVYDTNGNGVADSGFSTLAVVENGQVVAVITDERVYPDADYPVTREPSDIPTEYRVKAKLSTIAGC